MRTKLEMEADASALAKEIAAYWESKGGDYSGPGILEAVYQARPDLKKRAEALDAEFRALPPPPEGPVCGAA